MLDCLILGDSIAQGIAAQRHECVAIVERGITSQQFKYETINNAQFTHERFKTVIISLGTNDTRLIHTFTYLELLRDQIKADRVLWMLPQTKFQDARNAVLMVADQFHDGIIEIPTRDLSHDKIHLTASGYKTLAEQTKK